MDSIPSELIIAIVFVLGLLVGSFVNVLIYRLPRRKSVVFPRSSCPKCKALIPWYRNIPIISFILLRGKCGDCGTSIHWRYPAVELLVGLLFVSPFLRESLGWHWLFYWYFFSALVAATFIDLRHYLLPDKITLPGIGVGILGSFFVPQLSWPLALAGAALGWFLLFFVAWAYRVYAKRDGLGGGDVKYLAMIGAFLGPQGVLVTLVLASFAGSILGVLLILVKGKRTTAAIPFGPFLTLGALVSFFLGDELWLWYFGQR
jgi:leader peptidase (prepilin peptidase) / N-methyltransferase